MQSGSFHHLSTPEVLRLGASCLGLVTKSGGGTMGCPVHWQVETLSVVVLMQNMPSGQQASEPGGTDRQFAAEQGVRFS